MPTVSIPSNIARVPNLLSTQVMLGSITQSHRSLIDLQTQLASGHRVNKPSDDALASTTISALDDMIEQRDQRVSNLTHAEGALNNIDAALSEATNLMNEARQVGLSQIGVGADAETRRNQSEVIESLLRSLHEVSNRKYRDVQLFSGSRTDRQPFEALLGGFRYSGEGDGMVTDLGAGQSMPITMPGTVPFGAVSSRVEGDRDLDPAMLSSTRLADLGGARGMGVTTGPIDVNIDGVSTTVDLSDAHTVGDVADALQNVIDNAIPGSTVTIDPATGDRFNITLAGAGTVTISDLAGDGPAADLGIDGTFNGPGSFATLDVNPLLTEHTRVDQLGGVAGGLGKMLVGNLNQSREIDLSSATTVRDIMNIVDGLDLGIRVEINEQGTGLNFLNEVSGGRMSIGEVSGGSTASKLGVRTLSHTTLLSDFNDGLGVNIISGSVDPVTGLPDPSKDIDFRVTLKDGQSFDVDLAGATTVQDVLTTVTSAATNAGVSTPGDFSIGLAQNGNGIELVDGTAGGGELTVTRMNGSHAAVDLGIVGSTSGAILTGEDRAKVAVDSVFSHLISLRDALSADDLQGISLATDKLNADIERVIQARGTNGLHTRAVSDAARRQEDLRLQDTELRSQMQDLDYTDASIRFAMLQTQLQAALMTASRVNSLSLLDFLR